MSEVTEAFKKAVEQMSRDIDHKSKRLKRKGVRPFLNFYTGEVSAVACIMNPRAPFPKEMGK